MPRIHASCVILGECGVLIRGPSGSGKSRFARQLLFEAATCGRFARLVCDDQVEIEERSGRVIARAVGPIEGRLEIRGVGIVGVDHEPAAAICLVVDCGAEHPARMPEAQDHAIVSGVRLRRLVHHGDPAFVGLVTRLCGKGDTTMMLR